MQPNWQLADSLFGGTKAMREAATAYLPKEPGESDDGYKMRLSRTFLFPAYKRTVQALVGKVFSKPIVLSDDANQQVKDWARDIDLTKRTVTSFSMEVFELALRKGLSHIHIDFPKVENAQAQTLADERVLGNRPYMRIIDPSDVIFWWSERVDGIEKLMEVRIKEKVRERDGAYGEKFVEQIRVLRPGEYEVHRKKTGATTQQDSWEKVEEGTLSFTEAIPWTTVYTGRTGFMQADPPLLELANLNVSHWQSSSDQRNILRVARVPFLFGAGIRSNEIQNEQGKFELGANRMITVENEAASMDFVEHTGAAIEAGRQDLEDLKAEMAALGFELLIRRPGNETATARAIHKSEMDSALSAMAWELGGALGHSFEFMQKWVGAEAEDLSDKLKVNTDFGVTPDDAAEIDGLLKARAQGDISRETFWFELRRRGFLSEDFDPAKEQQQLDDEMSPPADSDDIDIDDGGGGEDDEE